MKKPVVILGVTGSVAAYRAADIARRLMQEGMEVRVCLSRAAQEFVTPTLFEALTGNPTLTHAFDEPVRGRMAHIDWAREARVLLVCPATANAIVSIAQGKATDMLTSILAATTADIVIAPAMNPQMYTQEPVQTALSTLARRGATIIHPTHGEVACGETGQGKLAQTETIIEEVKKAIFRSESYQGKSVVITAGSTREPLDSVRFIANRSSGKMGYALALAAHKMGARVVLISGPTNLPPPPFAEFYSAETAEEMLRTLSKCAEKCDLILGAAAVGDFRAEVPPLEKIPREKSVQITLVPNPDILESIAQKYPALPIVGFAAEIGENIERAQEKLRKKNLLAIALNDVSRKDIGFESDENELLVLFKDGRKEKIEKDSKFNVARKLLEIIHPYLQDG